MNLSLTSQVQKLIQRRVESGQYASPEDVIAAAVMNLDQQERFGEFSPGELDALIAEGEASIRNDGAIDGDKAFQLRSERRAQRRTAS